MGTVWLIAIGSGFSFYKQTSVKYIVLYLQ